MFWNDPTLYGASFPFKDIPPMKEPWLNPPWMNFPRFVPPTYGYLPPHLTLPPTPINPYLGPMAVNPYLPAPFTPFTPYAPFGVNPAFYSMYRPFPF
jgi:hypothetical protein